MGIKEDKSRFLNIVKGRIKSNLSKYISHGEIIGKQEDEFVKIPIPSIDIPNFRFGSKNEQEGVGQGDGSGGDPVEGPQQPGGKPGDQSADHIFETEISVDDLAQILSEQLELPRIEPKGNKNLKSESNKYNTLAPVGPRGLRNFKTTYKRAMKRQLIGGHYDKDKLIVPIKDDFKYKAPKEVKKPESQAVVFYLMDISGSMGDEQKKIVQIESFWINTWLKKNYKGLEVRFITHDASAKEVTEKEFFTVTAAGGTLISSAYDVCKRIIDTEYSPNDWNIYVFQFSDGDNWSDEDSRKCVHMIKNYFLPIVNSFNYGEIHSKYGSGSFSKFITDKLHHEKLIVSILKDREDILTSIKDFLGKGF